MGTGVGTAAVAAWVHRSSSLQRAKFSPLLDFLHSPLSISSPRAELRAQVPRAACTGTRLCSHHPGERSREV